MRRLNRTVLIGLTLLLMLGSSPCRSDESGPTAPQGTEGSTDDKTKDKSAGEAVEDMIAAEQIATAKLDLAALVAFASDTAVVGAAIGAAFGPASAKISEGTLNLIFRKLGITNPNKQAAIIAESAKPPAVAKEAPSASAPAGTHAGAAAEAACDPGTDDSTQVVAVATPTPAPAEQTQTPTAAAAAPTTAAAAPAAPTKPAATTPPLTALNIPLPATPSSEAFFKLIGQSVPNGSEVFSALAAIAKSAAAPASVAPVNFFLAGGISAQQVVSGILRPVAPPASAAPVVAPQNSDVTPVPSVEAAPRYTHGGERLLRLVSAPVLRRGRYFFEMGMDK